MTDDDASVHASRRRGRAAEDLAAAYLKSQGLEVIARNVLCKAGELDLVCLEGELLIIVEVRQRARLDFGGALASVTPRKQLKIIRAAGFMLRSSPALRSRRVRFDVLGLQGSPHGTMQMVWIKDAFRPT